MYMELVAVARHNHFLRIESIPSIIFVRNAFDAPRVIMKNDFDV